MNPSHYIKISIIIFSLTLIVTIAFVHHAVASDVAANSCSASDLQSAIHKVIRAGGGTVHIPACQADNTWRDGEFIRVTTDVTFRLKGAGKDATVIGYQDDARRGGMFFDGSGLVEISDFTFRGSDKGGVGSGIVLFSMNTENLRIHHLRIQKFEANGIYVCHNPDSPLIIDHNDIGDQFDWYMYGIRVHGSNRQSDFKIPASFGVNNPNAVFIEDNVFDHCYHSVSGFAASKIVFRYNTVTNPSSYIDGHGPCFDVGCRRDTHPDSGTYIYEIYNNTIDSGNYSWCINIRGGTGIVTDNTLLNCKVGFRLEMERCSAGMTCSLAKGCPHSNTDTNACYQSPYQWWIWNNDYRGSRNFFSSGDHFDYGDNGTGCIRENKEYYLRAPQAGDPVVSYAKYPYPHPAISGNDPAQFPKN